MLRPLVWPWTTLRDDVNSRARHPQESESPVLRCELRMRRSVPHAQRQSHAAYPRSTPWRSITFQRPNIFPGEITIASTLAQLLANWKAVYGPRRLSPLKRGK